MHLTQAVLWLQNKGNKRKAMLNICSYNTVTSKRTANFVGVSVDFSLILAFYEEENTRNRK